jgi:hypothetical protein
MRFGHYFLDTLLLNHELVVIFILTCSYRIMYDVLKCIYLLFYIIKGRFSEWSNREQWIVGRLVVHCSKKRRDQVQFPMKTFYTGPGRSKVKQFWTPTDPWKISVFYIPQCLILQALIQSCKLLLKLKNVVSFCSICNLYWYKFPQFSCGAITC